MDRNILEACLRGSFDGSISFLEQVDRLRATGVRRYEVDLLSREKRYYSTDDEVETEPMPITWPAPSTTTFSVDGVKAALIETQQGRITYPEFLRRIMLAGTASYTVFIIGRKAMYTGRDGDSYVEPFPGQP